MRAIRSALFLRLDPSSRPQALVYALLFALMGALMLVVKIHHHGLSRPVKHGIVTGGLIDAALIVLVVCRWNHKMTGKERRGTKAAGVWLWVYALLAVGVGVLLTVFLSANANNPLVEATVYVLCFGMGIVAYTIILAGKGMWQ
jgi:cytochrome bd-type quinol oxidase subunit 2